VWKGRNKPHRKDRRWVQAWSPEQISNRLRVDVPDDESMRISPEAIYQALYVQSRGALRRELVACLRTGRALRVPRGRATRTAWAHVTPEVMISERPAEADDRAVPGQGPRAGERPAEAATVGNEALGDPVGPPRMTPGVAAEEEPVDHAIGSGGAVAVGSSSSTLVGSSATR
jgi:hypothetical protein